MKRICKKCKEEKDINCFYDSDKNTCKSCVKKRTKKYKEENKERISLYNEKNKEKIKKNWKKYREENKEKRSKEFKKYYENNKDYFKEHRKKYYNSDKGKENKRRWCNEYNSKNKHIVLWRTLLRRTIIQLMKEKIGSTEEMLGYNAIDLKQHIEDNWLDGMSWNNYGEWHIDHIRSVATFDKETPASVVNALSNLQPMWATSRIIDGVLYEGNLNKGKKYY